MICSKMTVRLHIKGFIHINTFSSNFYRVGSKFKRENKFFICKCSRIRSGYCRGERSEPISNFIKLKMKTMHFLYTMFPAISLSSCQPDGVVTKSFFLAILREIENWTVMPPIGFYKRKFMESVQYDWNFSKKRF